MSIQNGERLVTKQDLADMYQGILPYLGGMPEVLANKFSKGDMYSTDEKMVGQWIDGKPLYQKTITGLKTPSITGNWQTVYTYDATFNIVNMFGYLINEGMSINTFAHTSYYVISVFVNNSHVIQQQVQNYTNQDEIITIQYTKTTDSAISIGEATDYSTEEKIVGTWIDGSPLWQKTIDCGALPNNTTKVISIGTNIDTIVDVKGIASRNGAILTIPRCYTDSTFNIDVSVSTTSGELSLVTAFNYSSYNAIITLQYTKTT